MGALLDLFRVLYEPGAVFGRVAEKPKFLMPLIGLIILQLIMTFLMMPYIRVLIASQVAQQGGAAAANPEAAQRVGAIFSYVVGPVALVVALLIGAVLLWVLQSVINGDAQFGKLLSVTAYSAITAIIAGFVGLIVLKMRGTDSITSQADLRPMLGLNLIAPNAGKFTTAILGGINPFGLWGMVLSAIGIKVTHKTTDAAAYRVAVTAFVIGLLVAASFALLQK